MKILIIFLLIFYVSPLSGSEELAKLQSDYHISVNAEEKANAAYKLMMYYGNSDIKKSCRYAEEFLALSIDSKKDSRKAGALQQISILNAQKGNFEMALKLLDSCNTYCDNPDESFMAAKSFYLRGKIQKMAGEYSESLTNLKKSLTYFENNRINAWIPTLYRELAVLHAALHDFPKALEYYFQALHIYEKENITTEIPPLLSQIGAAYYNIGESEQALEYFLKSDEKLRVIGDNHNEVTRTLNYNNIANIYKENKQYDKALDYYRKSMRVTEENDSLVQDIIFHYNLGQTYLDKKDFIRAEFYINKSIALSKKQNDFTGFIDGIASLGLIRFYENKTKEALKYLNESLELALEKKYPLGTMNILETLPKVYMKIGKPDKALDYLNRYHNYKDSLSKEENISLMKMVKQKVEAESLYRESENERQIQDLTLETQEYQIYSLILIGAFLIILILLILWRYRLRKRTNIILEGKNEELVEMNSQLKRLNEKLKESESKLRDSNITKDKFFSIIAHDLKNPAGSFVSLSSMLSDDLSKFQPDEIQHYMKALKKAAHSLYGLIENLLKWARVQTGKIIINKEKMDLYHLISNNFILLNEAAQLKDITFSTNIAENTLAYGDVNMINTVFRNLISNAIKYSNKGGFIKAVHKIENGKNLIQIIDNGVGISKENLEKLFKIDSTFSKRGTAGETGTGLGLILVKEFVEKNNGKIWIESNPGNGSVFSFTLPLCNNST